jgi:hypothetical protein
MREILIEKLSSRDMDEVVDTLYVLCGMPDPPNIEDPNLVRDLLSSNNSEIKERAIFLLGIKQGRSDLCSQLLELFYGAGDDEDASVVSALILAFHKINCQINVSLLVDVVRKQLDRPEIKNSVGALVVAFTLLVAGVIDEKEFRQTAITRGPPTPDQLRLAYDLLK